MRPQSLKTTEEKPGLSKVKVPRSFHELSIQSLMAYGTEQADPFRGEAAPGKGEASLSSSLRSQENSLVPPQPQLSSGTSLEPKGSSVSLRAWGAKLELARQCPHC